jgi:hypothetical protein
MSMRAHDVFSLSDDELLNEVRRLAVDERRATEALIRSLMEVDARRLFLREGCSSLFMYCTQVLHLEEGAAYNRIEVARTARRIPAVLDGLHDGSLTLAAVRLLAPHLTEANHQNVLASARHKSKRDVERLVATLHPRPDPAAILRKVPPITAGCLERPADPRTSPFSHRPSDEKHAVRAPIPAARPALAQRPTISHLSAERYTLRVTISASTHEKLRRAQDLLRHSIPNGDLEAVVDRALTLLVEDLERRRFAAVFTPRPGGNVSSGSRHVPAAVKRAVWRRDGGQCAFVGTHGRCGERGFLEFHHVQPFAAGGASTAENLQLRCRAHNQYEALLFFEEQGASSV